MSYSKRLLLRYMEVEGCENPNQASKALGVSRPFIDDILSGKSGLGTVTALKIARRLRIDELTTVARCEMDKKKISEENRNLLRRYAGREFVGALAAFALTVAQFAGNTVNDAPQPIAHNV